MGSDLFDVKVISSGGCYLKLGLRALSTDAVLTSDTSFALMVLVDSIVEDEPGAALAEAVGQDDVLNAEWQQKYARGIVSAVVATSKSTKDPESGSLELEVTHPAWIAHLKRGRSWQTRAFPLISQYDKAKPIAPPAAAAPTRKRPPAKPAAVPALDEDSFMVVPRECWDWLDDRSLVAALPASGVLIPAYGEKTYRARDEEEGVFRAKDVAHLSGQCVRVVDGTSKPVVGSLFVHKGQISVLQLHKGFRGCHPFDKEITGSIGVLERKPKALGAGRLRYEEVFGLLEPHLVSANPVGEAVELTVHLVPGAPAAIGAEEVLVLLFTVLAWESVYLVGKKPGQPLRPCTLSTLLEREIGRFVAGDYFPSPGSCAGRIAALGACDTFISGFEVSRKDVPVPDLDKASAAEARAYFAAAMPVEAKVRVTVTHPDDFLPLLATPIRTTRLSDFPVGIPAAKAHLLSLPKTDPLYPR